MIAAVGCALVAVFGGGSAVGAGATVDLYSSLPLQGASKAQTGALVKGIELALKKANYKAGPLTIKYTSLDDSTAQAGNWDPAQTTQNARKVAQDPNAVGYIGEFNSGASEVSIPILNQAGVPQVSPANTYVGLTTSEPGTLKGEPGKYYPTGKRTYLRIVPRDTIQGLALARLMKSDGCKAVAVANDKEAYGAGLARVVILDAKKLSLKVLNAGSAGAGDGIDKTAANYRSLASKYQSAGADCFFFGGVTANGAIQLYKDINAAMPTAKLYGGDGVCESGFTNPKQKGVTPAVDKKFQCTIATLNLNSYPGGKNFLAAFKKAYNDPHPDPYAIYGYEAGSLFVATLTKLGLKATGKDGKANVLKALFATKNRHSVLGVYSFDKNGDTTLTDYGAYKVVGGLPTYAKAIRK
ncbi:MAG TPA: branched-chain amino acid ABC transporter substrate-binding protein [Solirubrobacteraceae bacterium]|nr:branched-chain amino acid ABC transporter substrate-binding protein [Solirubrobacteraceae bacterium]